MRPMIEKYKDEEQEIRARAGFTHNHPGHVFQGVGCAIHSEMGIPKYLVRGRMIQLGYWQAQGALNYVQCPSPAVVAPSPATVAPSPATAGSSRTLAKAAVEGPMQGSPTSGHYIPPFTFSRESCPTTAHTFVISPEESFRLYEKNEEYRARLDTGDYVYVDGHICLNDPAYIVQASSGPWMRGIGQASQGHLMTGNDQSYPGPLMTSLMKGAFHTPHGYIMTDWANRHVDECCLRFENVYEVDENYEFRLNSINSDEEYNRHYIAFAAQGKEISAKEATEQQSDIIASLPTKPGEALKALMKMSGNVTIEQMAERALVSTGTVKNWRKEEYVYDPETAVRIIVALHLPPWVSTWFLQTCGIVLQFRGLHMMYRNIIVCHYMDTMEEVNALIEAAGFDRMVEFY